MPKKFFEVFSNLKKNDNGLLDDVTIDHISTNRDRDTLRIYMNFPALVPKRRIKALQNRIKSRYFEKEKVKISIVERFDLQESFSPEVLYNNYRDSILEEISDTSSILFGVFRHAKLDFPDEHNITVTLEDTLIAREREEQLLDILQRIFNYRCGQSVSIAFEYTKAKKGTFHEESVLLVKNKVNAIESRLNDDGADCVEDELMIKQDNNNPPAKKASPKGSDAGRVTDRGKMQNAKKAASEEKKKPQKKYTGRFNNPNIIYGRDFDDDAIAIETITDEIGFVAIRGEVIATNEKSIKNGRIILTFSVTDDTDTINVKLFADADEAKDISDAVNAARYVRIKGAATFDTFDKDICILSVKGIERIGDFRKHRTDNAPRKRVELHCHTKMSDMDGVSAVGDIIGQAKAWGHKAIAITDHGVVQAFPDAAHSVSKDDDFKVIYGCEVYLVDDTKQMITNAKDQDLENDTYIIFDLETTGLNAREVEIIEIGAVKYRNGTITERFSEFINPGRPIPYRITELTHITDQMVADAPDIAVMLPKFREFCGDGVLVAHNADFDCGCIDAWCKKLNIDWDFTYMDTIPFAKYLIPQLGRYGLKNVAKHLNVPLAQHHRAVYDAECTAMIFEKLVEMALDRNVITLKQLNEEGGMTDESIKKERPHHCIILAKNDLGRINLYRLISESHLKYMRVVGKSQKPNMPKSLVEECREGLIIGSACSEGELYQALLTGKSDEEIARIVDFYDYLEIQPCGNNAYLLKDDKYGTDTIEDLQSINRRIVELGREFDKPVAATCDVHFLNPDDEIYRRIIMAGSGYKDADEQPPLYLHTTEEMLEEFSYLGDEIAKQVVIETPNMIADMCERIEPTRPDKCPPVIADSDTELRRICYDRAHEVYGEELPKVVTERLDRELNSIIGNGYAVMYIIAQKLVWKSNEDGYLVGSRGSVGSSFAATMAGITEVNPLSPHYICESCHYVDFDSDEVKAYAGRAGCDMTDAVCPSCGKPLKKEGFDIPFETFLGFKGNKEPDIDLNFSGDYQNKAHRYTEVIFGEGQTFRAGTITGVAEKTAFGTVMKYFEEHGQKKRSCEVNRIVPGCVGVRKSTGQHPGGIIVLPNGENIYSFTPIQNPPKDVNTITTHFDYHSIDSNLLKLDILGHDDPTMIRMLEDLTGDNAQEIPLDDKKVMSLFKDTSALGLEPGDLWAPTKLGTLGIPEFGTDFAMQMLIDAKPTEFSDLVRIAGLAHGTDVWLGNAQQLIEEGKATISTCICTRDDIMTYLIGKGLDSEESFKIMEAVRKGMVAKGRCDKWDEWKQDMIDHEVPDWYIWSCEKIKYMFPKAHAAAYVMMAWRIAYWKIYKPLAYYAAYLSIRATSFNYDKMCQGEARVKRELQEIAEIKKDTPEKKGRKLTAKENDLYSDLRTVQEFYARGFEFLPMDLYESDPKYFRIIDGRLLPPLCAIDGMGDTAAVSLSMAAKEARFLSKDEVKSRGRISQTVLDTMDDLGILKGLPQSAQLSFFDMVS